jgi:hypothetical protein
MWKTGEKTEKEKETKSHIGPYILKAGAELT